MDEQGNSQRANGREKESAAISVWQLGTSAFRAILPQGLYLTIVGMAIPLILVDTYFDWLSFDKVREINQLQGVEQLNFVQLLVAVSGFASNYLVGLVGLALLASSAYFGLITMADRYFSAAPVPGATRAFMAGLRLELPRGFLTTVLVIVVLGFLQFMALAQTTVLSPIMSVLALMITGISLMAPVLLVIERRGIFSTVRRTLSLRYVLEMGSPRPRAFFQIVTLSIMLFGAISLVAFAGNWLLGLSDQALVLAPLWNFAPSWLPFGLGYFIANVLVIIAVSFLLMMFACVTTAFYVAVRRQSSPLATEGIEA